MASLTFTRGLFKAEVTGLDTVVLTLVVEVVDVVLVASSLLVTEEVDEVVVVTGVTLVGGFGLEILDTVIPVVRIFTLLGDTDWERGGSVTGEEPLLKSETLPGGENAAERGKEEAGLLLDVLVDAGGGEGFFIKVEGVVVVAGGESGGGGSSTSS